MAGIQAVKTKEEGSNEMNDDDELMKRTRDDNLYSGRRQPIERLFLSIFGLCSNIVQHWFAITMQSPIDIALEMMTRIGLRESSWKGNGILAVPAGSIIIVQLQY